MEKVTNTEQAPDTEQFFCLNPRCQNDMDRICKTDDVHFASSECRKWILKKRDYQAPPVAPIIHEQEGYFLDPSIDSLQTLLNLRFSFLSFQSRLKEILELVRNSFEHTLLVIENIVSMKIQKILHPVDEFYREMGILLEECKNLPSDIASLKIQELLRSPNLKTFLKEEPKILLKKANIEESLGKIKKDAEEMIEQLACDKEAASSDLMIGKSQIEELQKYLTDPNDDMNRRITKFANILKTNKKQLAEKDFIKKILTLRCCLCPFNIETELKKKERDYLTQWIELTSHLVASHLQEVGYNFQYMVSKASNYQTCSQNIIYLMSCYSYEGLQLIYSSGRRFYQFHHTNRKKLQIEILLPNQLPQCNVRYVYTANMLEFCGLLVMIAASINKVDVIGNGFGNPTTKKKEISVFMSKIDSEKPRKLIDKFQLRNVSFLDGPQAGEWNKILDEPSSYRCMLEEDEGTQV